MFSLNSYRRYGANLTSYDLLKLLAIVTMTIDHFGYYFFPEDLWWRVVGRTSAPVWLFLAGFSNSRRTLRLILAMAIIVALGSLLLGGGAPPTLNILFTIIIARAGTEWIVARGWHETRLPEVTAAFFFLALPTIFLFEYGTLGLMIALFGACMRLGLRLRPYLVYTLVTWGSYCLFQSLSLPYTPIQHIGMWGGNALIFALLWHFRIKEIKGADSALRKTGRFFARNSIYYYAIHRLAFQALAVWLGGS